MRICTTLVLLLAFTSGTGLAQLVTKKALTLASARAIVATAEAEAAKNKWNVVIVVVDDGGTPILLQRMDEVQIGSVEVALQKARTALKFKRPSKVFEDQLVAGRQAVLKIPELLPVEGGIPITVDGAIIGAIGVSGVQSNQDGQIARAGADAAAKFTVK